MSHSSNRRPIPRLPILLGVSAVLLVLVVLWSTGLFSPAPAAGPDSSSVPPAASSSGSSSPSSPVPSEITVPILLYHNVDEAGEGDYSITQETFLSHLDALQQAGYETVTFQQMAAYVERGEPLPEHPVALTFDDGYLSNYEIVWPALRERGMTGTIFIIGSSVGKDTYKDTGAGIIPHFSYEQAEEMSSSGVLSIQLHTYDMHQYQPLEPDGGRRGCLPRPDESPEQYRQALTDDFSKAIQELEENTSETALVLSYPGGDYSQEAEQVSAQLGLRVSVTTVAQPAVLVQADPSSLRLLGRYNIDDCTPQELLDLLSAAAAEQPQEG